jgi:hypothetical protein
LAYCAFYFSLFCHQGDERLHSFDVNFLYQIQSPVGSIYIELYIPLSENNEYNTYTSTRAHGQLAVIDHRPLIAQIEKSPYWLKIIAEKANSPQDHCNEFSMKILSTLFSDQ